MRDFLRTQKHIFWWLPHQLCIPRSLLLMVWPFFLCRPYKDKKQYRLACINFVCLIVHMYLECEFAFSSSWVIHSIRYNMFVLKKSVAHAFTVYVFPSYLVYTNSVYTWSLAYFFLKIIPKRELICRTLHTTHRIADRQFFMILYNYTYTVILSWYVFFVKFFFRRWIFLGYLVNLFVCVWYLCMYDRREYLCILYRQ